LLLSLSAHGIELASQDRQGSAMVSARGEIDKNKTKAIGVKTTKPSLAVFDSTSVSIKFQSDSRGFGQMATTSILPTVGDFSIFVSTTLKSVRDSSKNEADTSIFTNLVYVYTPRFHDFGIVEMYTDASGAENQSTRTGAYYWFVRSTPKYRLAFYPMLFPIAESSSNSRFTMLYSLSWMNRFGVSGHFNYVLTKKPPEIKDTISANPNFWFEILKGFRIILTYDYSSTLENQNFGWEPGLEFKTIF
jgi:hypothetical protein